MPQVSVEPTLPLANTASPESPRQETAPGADLGDSHFQLPIQGLPTSLSNVGEAIEPDQNDPFEDVDVGSSDGSTTGSWQDIPTPTEAGISSDGNTMPKPEVSDTDEEDLEEDQFGRPTPADYDEYYDAILRGDVEAVKAKLDMGVNLQRENDEGINALVLSLKHPNVEMTRMLLERGADARWRVNQLPPVMHAIVKHERAPQLIQLLMDHGANIHITVGEDKFNTLHYAIVEGIVDAVDFLLSKDMDLNAVCSKGRTPLHLAAEKGHITIAKVLLAKGAELRQRSENGGAALTWAACNGHLEMVEYLLEEGLEVDDIDDRGLTALSVASNLGRLRVVEFLIEKGADINQLSKQPRDFTPAMAAAIAGHADVLQALIRHGADLSVMNGNGETILGATMAAGQIETLKVLLEALGGSNYPQDSVALQIAASGTYTNVKPLIATISVMYQYVDSKENRSGNLAWMDWVLENGGYLVKPYAMLKLLGAAFYEENVDMVEALLRHGCDPNKHFSTGHTPLSVAIVRKNVDLIRMLLAAGADPANPAHDPDGVNLTPFHQAVLALDEDVEKDTTIVDLLLESKRCKLMEGYGVSSTVFANVICQMDHWEHGLAEVLLFRMLESIPNVNDDRSVNGSTLMHAAVYHERKDLIDILLHKGADINAADIKGRTPFLNKCVHEHKLLPYLIERGADVSARDEQEQSALHVAAMNGNTEGIEYLLKQGLDINCVDDIGHTPLIAAIGTRHQDTALYLLDQGANTSIITPKNGRTVLHFAARYCMKRLIERLIDERNADINARDKTGWTPLALACRTAPTQVITALLSRGADPEIQNDASDRPIHVALISGCSNGTAALLTHGIDLSAKGFLKQTPLQMAAEYSRPSTFRLLLAQNPPIDQVDDRGRTALFMSRDPEITDLLLDAGANISHLDKDGCMAIHEAVRADSLETFRVLLERGADMHVKAIDGLDVNGCIAVIDDDFRQQDFLYAVERFEDGFKRKEKIEIKTGRWAVVDDD